MSKVAGTLDNPFHLGGFVTKFAEYISGSASKLFETNPIPVYLTGASLLSAATKLCIGDERLRPCTMWLLYLGPPWSGKSTLQERLQEVAADLIIPSGTPEALLLGIYQCRVGIVTIDEFAAILRMARERGYLSHFMDWMKKYYELNAIYEARKTTEGVILPPRSYYVNFIMATTFDRFSEYSSVIDDAVKRRLFPVLFRRLPFDVVISLRRREPVSIRAMNRIEEFVREYSDVQVLVNISEAMIPRFEGSLSYLLGLVPHLPPDLMTSIVDYFVKLVAIRAADRALSQGKYEEFDGPAPGYRLQDVGGNQLVRVTREVWVSPDDIVAIQMFYVDVLLPFFEVLDAYSDEEVIRQWRRIRRLGRYVASKGREHPTVRDFLRYSKIKLKDAKSILMTLHYAGLIQLQNVDEETGELVPVEREEDIRSNTIIVIIGERGIMDVYEETSKLPPTKRVILELLKERKVVSDEYLVSLYGREVRRILKELIDEGEVFPFLENGVWYYTADRSIFERRYLGRGGE